MVVSLVFKDKHNVGINSYGNIKIDDKKIATKDIPFIRYRFDKYSDEELKFIESNMQKFENQVHLIEIPVDENTLTLMNKINANKAFESLVIFLYLSVTDDVAVNGFSEFTESVLDGVCDFRFDRIMLKDNSKHLYMTKANELKSQVASITQIKAADIGICSSPLSFRSNETDVGQACLTAVWARKLLAEYAKDGEKIAVPSANHECMDCCGCIKHIVIDRDWASPEGKKASGNGEKKAKEPKAAKEPKKESPKGVQVYNFF